MNHHHLTLPDVRLHVVTDGPDDGPPVVLLHGFPEAWFAWRAQMAALARAGFRAIAVDQRGYGTSDKPRDLAAYRIDRLAGDVVQVLEALGHARAAIVGHDWGGVVAWRLAMDAPERVDRLVILNAPHPGIVGRAVRNPLQLLRMSYAAFFQLEGVAEAALGARDGLALEVMMRGTATRRAFTRRALDEYRAAWSEAGAVAGMLSWYRAAARHPAPKPRSGRIRPPTLILWGRRDMALGLHMARLSLARCLHGRLEVFPEATHWLHHDDPDGVAHALVAFLREPHPEAPPLAL